MRLKFLPDTIIVGAEKYVDLCIGHMLFDMPNCTSSVLENFSTLMANVFCLKKIFKIEIERHFEYIQMVDFTHSHLKSHNKTTFKIGQLFH